MALACPCRRWGLAVTCACIVRHCACVLAPPMGAIPSGGLHLLGRIARDQLGLNLPDRVFRLIGNKRLRGAGRPWRPLVIVGDASPVFIGAPPGSPAPVGERDTRGNGGGFAALDASPRRVAGVSRL